MLPFLSIGCMIAAVVVLIVLSVIDLRTRLLPNIWVTTFAGLGILFHWSAGGAYLGPAAVMLGGLAGFGTLFAIRAVANHLYKQDALGLGDVKLMGAAGLWLGPEGVMLALSLGAFAGLLHGLAVGLYQAGKTGKKPDFTRLQIPAGPGFSVGIVLAGTYQFLDL
ncbi:MAG: prepilin peptidase [Alphaproteobacteria bacterium]|nr:prepilin peptidase [Alphaproteobacteria bacterium]